jgi:hypothetical protein
VVLSAAPHEVSGARAVLRKPIDLTELLATIEQHRRTC